MTLPDKLTFEDLDTDGEVADEIIKRYNEYARLAEQHKALDQIRAILEQENKELKETIRQLRFNIADEQDSHSHVECNNKIKELKTEISKQEELYTTIKESTSKHIRILQEQLQQYNQLRDAIKKGLTPKHPYMSQIELQSILDDVESK
jgi:predicted  nucleic acid-binding Zn-ribbon protein